MNIQAIAHIKTDFSTKFGIPRQSGLTESLESTIIFEPDYRIPEALRGIEGFSHLWLIWGFSSNINKEWSPTVRPPRLGGDARVGVFATRSSFRPNGLGLSCVRLLRVEDSAEGKTLLVSGADLMDGTPIYDIKPYLPYADSIPDATSGFISRHDWPKLEVIDPQGALSVIPTSKQAGLIEVLSQDPRPAYQDDPERVYGFNFDRFDVRFQVKDGVLYIT
ncbi:MAG: tRNA (N6-threonylcarbamoyladenosine(37)-N6)-methyltransferase TrmO, partial [Clostridiales bacterium]|nr:tRNA (N6-threonylcarbamoyladenosine(37)-N6)-methyltransferase TrmO [Clostridiales bacterium]